MNPARCVFYVPYGYSRRLKICRYCGRVVKSDRPSWRIWSKHLAYETAPVTSEFVTWTPCAHRGGLLGTIPSGRCCGMGWPLRLASCAVLDICVEGTPRWSKAHMIGDIFPAPCHGCPHHQSPPGDIAPVADGDSL